MGARVSRGFVHTLDRDSDWSRVRVTVAGLGVAGYSCADALMQFGAIVTVIDDHDTERQAERAEVLRMLGVQVFLGGGTPLPADTDVLVVSPGLKPQAPLIQSAIAAGLPVWGELELAWRLRSRTGAAEWLCVTGTNGKTTSTLMLESMLRASGARTIAAGNIGNPLVDVVMHDHMDVIAIEVGAPQLPFVQTMSPLAAVCLNFADDHLDHFGGRDEYFAAKSRIFHNCRVAAVYDVNEPATRTMVEQADVIEGCRAIGITKGVPSVGMLGVVEDLIVDRAFISERAESAQELAALSDIRPLVAHNVSNALGAAALARAFGVEAQAVRDGLRSFEPAAHRIAEVGEFNGVRYVDDSKATNAHAAATSLRSYESVVWIGGGLAKGQRFDDLVREVSGRLRAAVLIGTDAGEIADALGRHAPDVPVIIVERPDTGAMSEAVTAAQERALPGDVVLLAPGCASWDMFDDYSHRGRTFVEAVLESAAR